MIIISKPFRKDYLKNGAFLFTGRIMPMAALFFITLIYSRKLSLADYGLFQSVWMFTNMLTVIIGFGVNQIILSTPDQQLRQFLILYKRKIAWLYSGLCLLSFVVFVCFTKGFSNQIMAAILLFALIQLVTVCREAMLIKRGFEKKLLAVNIVYSLLFFGWHVYVIYTNYNLLELIIGVLGLLVVKFLMLRAGDSLSNDNSIALTVQNDVFYGHWIFTGLNDIVGVFSKWIDKLFLLYLLSASDFAIFFNGSFEIPLFGLLITVAGSMLMARASRNIEDKARVVSLFRENFFLLSAVVFPIFLFIVFNLKPLFLLAFGNKYDASLPIFFISLFVLPIRINNYGALLQSLGKGRVVFTGSVLDILIVSLIIIFAYPIYGTKGVAAAVVIGTYFQVVYYLFHSIKETGVSLKQMVPIWPLVKRFFILLLIYGWSHAFLPKQYLWLRLGAGTILTILIIIAGLYKFKNTNDLITDGPTE